MWFYPVLLAAVILAVVGGSLGGGIYTIVLVPLAAIVLVSAIVYSMWSRALQTDNDGGTASRRPLPHRPRRPSGRAPSSPEALADARRHQQ